jgi:uncharacterized protein (TIGR00369 family)
MSERDLNSDGWCFACGAANPAGLHLEFEEGYETYFETRPEHTGYAGIVHGGLIATVLDEVAARYTWVRGEPAVTAKMELRFRQPVRVGERLRVKCQLTGSKGRLTFAQTTAFNEQGELVAEAKVTLARLDSQGETL